MHDVLLTLLQASTHPFTDLLNLNSPPATGGGSLLVDVFSESVAPAAVDVSEENFSRWVALQVYKVCIQHLVNVYPSILAGMESVNEYC